MEVYEYVEKEPDSGRKRTACQDSRAAAGSQRYRQVLCANSFISLAELSLHRAGKPALNYLVAEDRERVKGGEAAVHIPLTGKGFLLLRHPICVIDRQLGMNDAPTLPPSGPFLRNVHHGEIQHFQQTVIRRKNRLGFGDLAKLAIEALNGIGPYRSAGEPPAGT